MDLETTEFLKAHIDEFGSPGGQQPLRRRLGPRHLHPLSVDQAGGFPLRWDPERHGGPLAGRVCGQGRDAVPVPSRHRYRPDNPGSGRHPGPDVRARYPADAAARREHAVLLRRCRCSGASRDPVLRDRLQPRDLPPGLDGGDPPQHPVAGRRDAAPWTTTPGSSTTPRPTGRRPTIWPPNSPRSSASSSGCSSSRRSSTAPSRSTTAGWSGSWPSWPDGPS